MAKSPKTASTPSAPKDELKILAFRKSLTASYFTLKSLENFQSSFLEALPIKVITEAGRGLNATYGTSDTDKPKAAIFTSESAYLEPGHTTLFSEGSVTFSNALKTTYACNSVEYQNKHKLLVDLAIANGTFKKLSTRYAIRLATGSFMARNALEAINIKVIAKFENETLTFTNFVLSQTDIFNLDNSAYQENRESIEKLASWIERGLLSDDFENVNIKVEVLCELGLNAKVHPSQLFPSDELKNKAKEVWGKDSGGISKYLAQYSGCAVLTERKVANELRKVDTGYSEDKDCQPIPFESYGANSFMATVARGDKDKSIFGVVSKIFKFEDKNLEKFGMSDDEFIYYFGCVIRGGLYQLKQKDSVESATSSDLKEPGND